MVDIESGAIKYITVSSYPLGNCCHNIAHLLIRAFAGGSGYSNFRERSKFDMCRVRIFSLHCFVDLYIYISILIFFVMEYRTAVARIICNQVQMFSFTH